MNRFTETIYPTAISLKGLAHLDRLAKPRSKQFRVTFMDLLVDNENHGAAHLEAAQFTALLEGNLRARDPVKALTI